MTSRFGWLDHDDAQRAQMMEVVKLFQDQGSVDVLDMRSIRGGLPDTSVLLTRARYTIELLALVLTLSLEVKASIHALSRSALGEERCPS